MYYIHTIYTKTSLVTWLTASAQCNYNAHIRAVVPLCIVLNLWCVHVILITHPIHRYCTRPHIRMLSIDTRVHTFTHMCCSEKY